MSGILKILPSFHTGGVELSTLLVVNYIAANGLKAYVASSGGILEAQLSPNVTHINLALNSKNPIKILYNALKLKKIISKYNVQVIHAGSRAPAWSGYIAAKLAKIGFITTYHGAYGQNCLKWYYNKVMALGKPVIVASEYMKKHVQTCYPGTECTIIPSGIDTNFFQATDEINIQSHQIRESLALTKDRKVILLLGRFTRIKGHEFLLRSIQNLNTKPIVIFVGDSKNPKFIDYLKQIANENGIDLFVYQDESDIRPFYNLADVVVVPTTKPEAFGRVTVEAMSMGKVVIGNDLGASSEIINDQDWIFNSKSTQSLANVLNKALVLPIEQAKKIGQQNRERAKMLYDVTRLTNDHLQIYRKLL